VTVRLKLGLVLGILVFLELVILTAKVAAAPCPISAATGKCVKPSVSYTFRQPGHDQAGNHYWRTCHVPLHRPSFCGPWRRA
jgi:hypothetical protein